MNSRLIVEGGQVFLTFEDGAKFPIISVPVNQGDAMAALENGMIVTAATAIAVARVERDYWRMLAEKRGVQLADERSRGQGG